MSKAPATHETQRWSQRVTDTSNALDLPGILITPGL